MAKTRTIVYPENEEPVRIDRFVAASFPDFSRSQIKKLIEENSITCNKNPVLKASHKITSGDKLSIIIPDPEDMNVVPEDIPLDIIYQDKDLVVINKAPGIMVHPAGRIVSGTLVNALLFHLKDLSGINGVLRPGIVHRLDKDTSGVMLIAKNDRSHRHLAGQFETRTITKKYMALVWGIFTKPEGVINRSIARSKSDRKIMVSGSEGRESITHYSVREEFEYLTLLDVQPKTGRTHQIRSHFSSIGHPVFGDTLYKGRNQRLADLTTGKRTIATKMLKLMQRQALHAEEIVFVHPSNQTKMSFSAPVPGDFEEILVILRKEKDLNK